MLVWGALFDNVHSLLTQYLNGAMRKVLTRKVLKVPNLKIWHRVVLTACRRHLGIENIALERVVRLG